MNLHGFTFSITRLDIYTYMDVDDKFYTYMRSVNKFGAYIYLGEGYV
jgi:hypothetical protein